MTDKIIIIETPCSIKVKDNNVSIWQKELEKETLVHFDNINTILLESDRSNITIKAINLLLKNNINLITCGSNFIPLGQFTNIGQNHFAPFRNLKAQINSTKLFRDEIWQIIIKAKMQNQLEVMKFMKIEETVLERVSRLIDSTEIGDITNKEASVAKMYFRDLFGELFYKKGESKINACLNYGYSIFSSLISRLISANGLIPTLGIHHRNENNYWNLTYDLVEVIRPLVDYCVLTNPKIIINGDLNDKLTKDDKHELSSLLKKEVIFKDKNRLCDSSLREYITSFVTTLISKDLNNLKTPKVKKIKW